MPVLKSNLWVFETHRPGYRIFDCMRNKNVRELYEAIDADTLEDMPKAKKHGAKHASYLSLDHSQKEINEMLVAQADEVGRITTDDPVTAFLVKQDLSTLHPINHPLTRKPFTYEVDRLSPEVPASLEAAVKLAEKAKKV